MFLFSILQNEKFIIKYFSIDFASLSKKNADDRFINF